MADTTLSNDGGVVATLFFAAGTIALVLFGAVALYEASTSTPKSDCACLLRLLSGWANLSNAAIHFLLVVYTLSNSHNQSEYWIEERTLGGIEGPAGLTIINFLAGYSATRNYSVKFPMMWNCFVAIVGTLMPVVWLRFLEDGLKSWPYPVVFIWFCVFFFELTAVTSSVTHVMIVGARSKGKKE